MALDKRWLWGGAAVVGALILLYVARGSSAQAEEAQAASANDGSLATLASYIAALPQGGSISGGTVTQPSTSTAVDLVALQKLSNDAAEARSESAIKLARIDLLGSVAETSIKSLANSTAGRIGGGSWSNFDYIASGGGDTGQFGDIRLRGNTNMFVQNVSYAPPPPPPPAPAPVVVKKKGK